MALEFRWLTFQQVIGLRHVAFFFFFSEYLASSGVAFSFFFSFFSFLDVAPTISLFLYMFLSLPMREDDLASNCVLQLMGSV